MGRTRLESRGTTYIDHYEMETKQKSTERPRQRWEERVEEDLRKLGVLNGEELAEQGKVWREIVERQ